MPNANAGGRWVPRHLQTEADIEIGAADEQLVHRTLRGGAWRVPQPRKQHARLQRVEKNGDNKGVADEHLPK